jgi:hypothetical protein
MTKPISTCYIIFLTAGVVVYILLVSCLLAAVQFRSACGTICDETACTLHKTTAVLLLYTLVSNLIVPLFFLTWIRCWLYKRVAYTLLGGFLVCNATLACGAGTLVVTVEHLLCPSDPAVEFAGVLLIFVAQTWSAMLVEIVFRKRQALDLHRYGEYKNTEASFATERFVDDPSHEEEL